MAGAESSVADVLKTAVADAQDLVRGEIALAKAELRAEIARVKVGLAALAAAAFCALLAVVFLLTAVGWGIAEGLGWPVWSGFAIVTLLCGLAAGVLAYLGQRRLAGERHMPLTTDTLKENLQWMRARTS